MMIVATCFDVKRCAFPQPFAFTIPYGQHTRKTPSTYAYTSFTSNEAASKHLSKLLLFRLITNWPHAIIMKLSLQTVPPSDPKNCIVVPLGIFRMVYIP